MCPIDLFSKYAWVVPIKDKKGVSRVDAFPKILKEPHRKPNKIWVDKESEFYHNLFKKWLKDNGLRCTGYITKENQLLLKDFLEHWKTRFLYKWKLFQRMFILMC